MQPSKTEMKQIAERLTRKKFACKIETQGTEHIVRCNWDNSEELPDGKIIMASVIPKQLGDDQVLDVFLNIGSDRVYRNEAKWKEQFKDAEEGFNPLMEAKGFELHNKIKEGNFPIQFRGVKKITKITEADIEDVNSFINLYASKFHTK